MHLIFSYMTIKLQFIAPMVQIDNCGIYLRTKHRLRQLRSERHLQTFPWVIIDNQSPKATP